MLLVVLLALNSELSCKWQCGWAAGRGTDFRQCLETLVAFFPSLICDGNIGEGLIHSFSL